MKKMNWLSGWIREVDSSDLAAYWMIFGLFLMLIFCAVGYIVLSPYVLLVKGWEWFKWKIGWF